MMTAGLVVIIGCNDSPRSERSRKKDTSPGQIEPTAASQGDPTSTTQEAPSGRKCLKVVGGSPTDEYPYVGLLSVAGGTGICTGTFVGHNTMITAAHCVAGKSKDGNLAYVQNPPKKVTSNSVANMYGKGVKPLKIFVADKAKALDGNKEIKPISGAAKDLAILIFPDETAPETTAVLRREATAKETVTIVGYGMTEWKDPKEEESPKTDFFKRVGTNKLLILDNTWTEELVRDFGDDFYIVGGPATSDGKTQTKTALGAPGDSGGPLLVNETVVGVMVVGMKNPEEVKAAFGNTEAVLFHVKLQEKPALDLMDKAVKAGGQIEFTDAAVRKPKSKPVKSESTSGISKSDACS